MEPAEPDTEAIKKAAEEAARPRPAAGEPVPPPAASDKKEQEKRERERKELDKKERKRIEKGKKEAEKRESERLKKERKEREKADRERKSGAGAPTPAAEVPAQTRPQPVPARTREPAPPPAVPEEPKKQPEPGKSEAPAKPSDEAHPKPAEPVKAEAAAPAKPVEPNRAAEPAKAAKRAADDDDDDAPPKPAVPAKPAEAPKPSEPVKAEAAAPKPAEPAKVDAPPKPVEPVKAEAAAPKPAEPAKVDPAPKPVEPAKAEGAARAAEPAKPVKAPPQPVEPVVLPEPVAAEPSAPAYEPTAGEWITGQGEPKSERSRRGDKSSAGGLRVGLRASIGIGGLGGHEPVRFDSVKVYARRGDPGAFTVSDPDPESGGDPIYMRYISDELELGFSLSGGVGVTLLGRINDLLSLSCGLQYSFYVASGNIVYDKNEYGETNDNAISWPLNEASVELHSLEIPILFRINAEEVFGCPIYAEVGPQIGFNVYARRTEYVGGDLIKLKISKPNRNILAFGPVFGAGLDLERVSVDLRLHFGFMKYQEYEGGRPWSITAGVASFF
ncbi:MAG: outer membrane beta-barrel protein [Chitinispirillales bacterium]|nr:outer membrane beta-barrel protein [Chitinispirillales bacterium]